MHIDAVGSVNASIDMAELSWHSIPHIFISIDTRHSMRIQNISLTLATLLFTAAANAAEISIKPGLWEITTTSNLLSLTSQLPPDQMQNINELAKEYGVELPDIKDGAAKSTTCVTPEMAKQKIVPSTFENQAGCTVGNITRNGNAYRMNYVCKNPQLEGSGEAHGTLTDTQHFNGQTTFNGTVQGNPINEQANIQGKWMGANCNIANN